MHLLLPADVPASEAGRSVNYPDKWFKILGIPLWSIFFRHIAESAPLVDLMRDPQYYLDIIFIMVSTSILWYLNYFLINWLDKNYSWEHESWKRVKLQFLIAVVMTTFFVVSLSFFYYNLILLVPRHPNITYLIFTEVSVSLLFVLILHMAYSGMWMIDYHKKMASLLQDEIIDLENRKTQESEEVYKKTIVVKQEKTLLPIALEHAAYFYIENEQCFVRTFSGNNYVIDGNLEQLKEQLPPKNFFRISRQFIINKEAIKKIQSGNAGTLILQLHPQYQIQQTVSRRRSPDFKQWLEH